MTNTALLKEFIENSGYKLSYIAEKLGISRAGLHKKMTNKTEFTASEVARMAAVLNLTNKQRDLIFFSKG